MTINTRVYAAQKGWGTVIEIGETFNLGRVRVKWDFGPRTWYAVSRLKSGSQIEDLGIN